MSYIQQRDKWLAEHPEATAKEAWDAGYRTSTQNWVEQKR